MQFSAIPTNVITGFLGVGKTTAIQHLLANKPENERWAVLVNEFGEVGIDASMMGEDSESGIYMREVPGGCMCCTAGLPMQMALNQLIQRAKPDRLLIEPTGLGHPQEVLASLRSAEYSEVIQLQATITLVDARKLSDPEYVTDDTYQQQIQVADCIVAHKADLYNADELQQLERYLEQQQITDRPVYSVAHGQLQLQWLDEACQWQAEPVTETHHSHGHSDVFAAAPDMPEQGYLRKDNKGDGYFSSGWVFQPDFEFDFVALESILMGIDAERVKGVFITDEGVFAFNIVDGLMSSTALDEVYDSRIEVIGRNPAAWQTLETDLLAASERL
ncbi:CobW family GTP-binding protein [Aliamphritea ceti]|uniref:CobW family GTP-binding protein n=1 Tax=Aliamphritea ceti TaxID=1524258 RepID=UPI0021C2FB2D|nr:GTP-binding protein [Aliamphritea ceti]